MWTRWAGDGGKVRQAYRLETNGQGPDSQWKALGLYGRVETVQVCMEESQLTSQWSPTALLWGLGQRGGNRVP